MPLGFATLHIVIEETKRLRALAKTYRQLFASEASVDALVGIAPTTAGLIQQSFHETMILSMGRMLDPESRGRYQNLSLENFIQDLPSNAEEFRGKLDLLQAELTEIRQWRNKFYAHRDEETAYSLLYVHFGEEALLGDLTGNDIVAAAEKTCDFVADIEMSIGLSNVLQQRDISGPDGDRLIQALLGSYE